MRARASSVPPATRAPSPSVQSSGSSRVVPPLPVEATANQYGEMRSARGSLDMYNPVPGVLVTRAIGHLDAAMSDQWIRRSERLFHSTKKLAIFNDWEFLDTYDSASRRDLTQWVLDHRARIEGAWFLTGSRIVAMGVAVAGTATALAGVTLNAALERPYWERLLRARFS